MPSVKRLLSRWRISQTTGTHWHPSYGHLTLYQALQLMRLLLLKNRWPRLLHVAAMFLMLIVRPEFVHRFSTRKRLPVKAGRILRESNPLDEWVFISDPSTEIPLMEHANVVMKGSSFDRDGLSRLTGPTFLVNWPEKVFLDNVIYAAGNSGELDRYLERDMLPLFIIDNFWLDLDGSMYMNERQPDMQRVLKDPRNKSVVVGHKAGFPVRSAEAANYGTGLRCIVAMMHLAKSVDVYGWDYYLEFPPARHGFLKSLLGMYNVQQDIRTSRDVLEGSIYNWHYADRFSQIPSFKNHGYLRDLGRHKALLDRFERVLYKIQEDGI